MALRSRFEEMNVLYKFALLLLTLSLLLNGHAQHSEHIPVAIKAIISKIQIIPIQAGLPRQSKEPRSSMELRN